ncbi:MAG: flagellar biosynthesis protein FliL [Sedimenticola sp.]|nr:MAG: flagellar biosynthesis protein FliL [Sedimenticola sp.]
MADAKIDEDLDLGIEKGSNKKLIFIIAGVVLLLIIGGVAGWFFLSGGDESEDAVAEEEVVEEKLPPAYHSLDPKFVVNLPPGGKAKMLQAGVDVMTRNPETIEFLVKNDPMIRHNLLNLFGEQDAAGLYDRAGKEKLQAKALEIINGIIKEQSGPGEVEAVYFSSFVMQ